MRETNFREAAVDNKDVIKTLQTLAQLDVDAYHAYAQAIEKISQPTIRERILSFQGDHERHVTELNTLISGLGGEPEKFARDFKGYLIEGFTSLRSITGTQGALAAMQTNEKMTNRRYQQACDLDLPATVMEAVRKNRGDERVHLQYIEEQLDLLVREGDSPDRGQRY